MTTSQPTGKKNRAPKEGSGSSKKIADRLAIDMAARELKTFEDYAIDAGGTFISQGAARTVRRGP